MMPAQTYRSLVDRLPTVRGELVANAPLAKQSWFQVGGPAEVLFKPADAEDLAQFLTGCPNDVPITVIGAASNMIIRDGGVPGVVIKLGKPFSTIDVDGDRVYAGAAALDMSVAMTAAREGVAGLEFLIGIPGSIGGALRMNAGCYGSETVDVLLSATAITRDGELVTLDPHKDMTMTYRHNTAPSDLVFIGATFQGSSDEPAAIQARMAEIKAARGDSQPLGTKTGGSTFANPDGHKSWELIDAAGCRGLRVGGAVMSEKHCNFMINEGTATAADIEGLGEEVRRRVKDHAGIDLRWEIRRIGVTLDDINFETKGTA